MLNGKIKIIILIIGLIKKILLYKISYFPKPYTHSQKKRDKWKFSNYATKSPFNSSDTSNFTLKSNLAYTKSDFDELDIDKLNKCTKCLEQYAK